MASEANVLNRASGARLLGFAILLAALVRLFLFWQYYCISSDGVHYIDAAKDFFSGRTAEGLSSVYPPGYPLMVASLYALIGNWEIAGQIWSLLSGVLLLIPLYVLCKRLYGEKVALAACFLAAIAPHLARYSAHVRTESLFILLSTVALLLFHQGIEAGLVNRFFYGGLVSGFAYLVRPESIGFLAIVPITLAVRCWVKHHRGFRWFFGACLLLLVGFLLPASPFIYYLSLAAGQWGTVSRKAGVTLFISLQESGLLEALEPGSIPNLGSLTMIEFISNYPTLYMKKVALDLLPSVGIFFEALYYAYVPFLLVGLWLAVRRRFWEREDLLLAVFSLFYIVGFALIYVNRRYSVQMIPAALGWTAVGLLWCWDYLKKFIPPKNFGVIGFVLASLLVLATLGKTLKPISPEKAHVREAGWYFKGLKGSDELRLLVFDDRISFYGEAKPILLSELKEQDLIRYLRQGKADYLATEIAPWQQYFPMVAQSPGLYGLVWEREFRATGKGRLIVFKVGHKEGE